MLNTLNHKSNMNLKIMREIKARGTKLTKPPFKSTISEIIENDPFYTSKRKKKKEPEYKVGDCVQFNCMDLQARVYATIENIEERYGEILYLVRHKVHPEYEGERLLKYDGLLYNVPLGKHNETVKLNENQKRDLLRKHPHTSIFM